MLEAPKKPTTPCGASEHVGGVLRLGDRPAVAEDEDVRVDRLGRVVHRLDALDGTRRASWRSRRRSCPSSSGPCAARGRRPRPRPSARASSGVEHVRAVSRSSSRAASRSSRPRARSPCPSPRGSAGRCRRSGRRWGSSGRRRSPVSLSSPQEDGHEPERVGAADAGQHRRVAGRSAAPRAAISTTICVGVAVRQQARRASRGRPSGSGRSCR